MCPLALTRLDGTRTTLTATDLEPLDSVLDGGLIQPGDPYYDRARLVWNGMVDRRPALIARCRGLSDVRAAVHFAARHEALLAVRGGGHNVAGYGTCDGGLVLDLAGLRHVRVDPTAGTVRVAGGATWADVDRETQAFDQAVPGGIVSTTGVAGLTLGGGQGWLRRTFGMTSDNLVSVEVVTAAGDVLTANEDENPELFWAVRGGGGNFGVVTSFEFRMHPVGPLVAFAGPVYPVESTPAVVQAFRDFVEGAPDEVNASLTWWSIPPVDTFPAELHGRAVVIVGAVFVGDPQAGEPLLMPLRAIQDPLLDLSGRLPYTALQRLFDPFFPPHELRYYWKSLYLREISSASGEAIADHVARRPSSESMVALWALGGALDRVEASATPAGAGHAPFLVEILANWRSPGESDANIAWARDLFSALEPHGTGQVNLNFPGLGQEPGFTRAALRENWDRLVRAKRRFDPRNAFRLNQNISP